MKRHTLRTAACVMLVGTVLAAFVAIAADVGSEGDPLVTLSYLNETFMENILDGVNEKLTARDELLAAELAEKITQTRRDLLIKLGGSFSDETGGVAVSFEAVTLSPGQIIYGVAGCEVLLREGSAVCISDRMSVPGLVDTTDGVTINHGEELELNHLYMMTEQRGVQATEDVLLLVRGEYTITGNKS